MLIGNLTRDPDVRYTPKGAAVADIGLALNRTYTVNEERREEVTFVDVVLWARLAELAQQYLTKGRSVYIEGRLELQTWTDKATGQNRSKMRVVGESMQFLGSKNDAAPQAQAAPQSTPKPPPTVDLDGEEQDDIPF